MCCGVWFGVRAVSVTHESLACPFSRSSGEYVCIATLGGRSLQSSTPEGVFGCSLATRPLWCPELRSEDSARQAAGLVFRVGLVALESRQARVSELEALLESRGNVGGTLVAGMGSSPGREDLRSDSSRRPALEIDGVSSAEPPFDEPPLPRFLALAGGRSGQLQSAVAARTPEIEWQLALGIDD